MPTDKPLLGHYLYQKFEMSSEEVEAHIKFVNRELDKIANVYYKKHKKLPKRETIIAVAFSPLPIPRHRIVEDEDKKVILDYKTHYSLADDKKEFPSIFDNEFVFGIKTTKRVLMGRVYRRYRWNNADIVGVIQILALCSRDDRRVVLASGIHDFLLEYREEMYKQWSEQSKLSIKEFRWITSDTFRWICEQQGLNPVQATVMSNIMDCFQKHWQKKKWDIEIEEA